MDNKNVVVCDNGTGVSFFFLRYLSFCCFRPRSLVESDQSFHFCWVSLKISPFRLLWICLGSSCLKVAKFEIYHVLEECTILFLLNSKLIHVKCWNFYVYESLMSDFCWQFFSVCKMWICWREFPNVCVPLCRGKAIASV